MSNEFKHPPAPDHENAPGEFLGPPEQDAEHEVECGWQPQHPLTLIKLISRLVLLAIILVLIVLPFTPYASKIKNTLNELVDRARTPRDVPRRVEIIKEVPAPPPPLPSRYVGRKGDMDVATLFNGINIHTKLETSEGTYATLEGNDPASYTVEFQVKVRVPKANDSIGELARVNPHLPKMLPGLEKLLPTAKVSGFYHKIYENKVALVEKNLTRLNKILDKHNFFDTETILEIEAPSTKRKAVLIQSDMDVVADGSDGDRMSTMDSSVCNSDYYQPFTSYEWAKQSTTPNPLLARWQGKLDSVKKEHGAKGLSSSRNSELKSQIQSLEADIHGLKTRSSLISEKDPFIVIPLLFKGYERVMPQTPCLGDYCAVIYEDKIMPAICGDFGPSMKMGEASLLLAKMINEHANPNNRGSDELKVTYLIFPGTAEKPFGPPNLDKWHEKISGYLKELGGVGDGYALHHWETPKPPAPATPEVIAKVGGGSGEVKTPETPSITQVAPALPADSAAPATTSTVTVNPPANASPGANTATGTGTESASADKPKSGKKKSNG